MADFTELLHDENRVFLRKNALFAGLSDSEIADFIRFSRAEYIELAPQQTVSFAPGDRQKIGIILMGNISVFTVDYSGRKTILHMNHARGAVGSMLFMVHRYNLLYEIFSEAAGKLALIDPETVLCADRKMVETQHKILVNLMLSQRQYFFTLSNHLICLSQKTIRDKVLRYLQLCSEEAHAYEFDIPLSREDLAAYLAVDRASLSRSLGALKREGAIDFRKNHFVILDTRYFQY